MKKSRDSKKANRDFEEWWDKHGQFHRSGPTNYCKTFAYEAFMFARDTYRVKK